MSYKEYQFGLRQTSSLSLSFSLSLYLSLPLSLSSTKFTEKSGLLFNNEIKKNLMVDNNLATLYINNFEITRKTVFKFIGIYIDKNLTWKYHVNMFGTKSQKV